MNWFAIRVEPGRERRVSYRLKLRAVALGAMRIYLPICEETAYLDLHRTELGEDGKIRVVPTGETQHVRGTIVPGYIFVQTEMNDDVAADIAQITDVVKILPSSRQPVSIDASTISGMRRECDKLIRQTGETHDLDWMLGKAFKVEQGPMAGRIGICFSFSPRGEPQLTLEVFKARYQSVALSLQHLNLEPVPDDFAEDVDIFRQKRISKATNRRNRCRTRVAV